MQGFADTLRAWLPDNNALKYLTVFAALLLAFLLLRYLSRALQTVAHRILKHRGYIGQSWLSLMDSYRVAAHLFFALGAGLIAAVGAPLVRDLFPQTGPLGAKLLDSVLIVSVTVFFSSGLSVISRRYYQSIKFPVQGLVQAIKVLLWSITLVLLLSVMIEKDPWYFIGSLTALSAVILLVFKDSIIGLAAGFQLALNDLVRVGDWIEVPGSQANGSVTNILLTTVRVQNWDNTVVSIPAYNLLSGSFRNWRGVNEAGSRRIQRTFLVDIFSIRILSDEEKKNYKGISLLGKVLGQNRAGALSGATSNLGLFRLYCEAYIRSLPDTKPGTMIMVHNLDSSAEGQVLEILFYSSLTGGVAFENFQSAVVEHILVTAPAFGLKMFQRPAGNL